MENVAQSRGKGTGIEVSFCSPHLTLYGGIRLLDRFVRKLGEEP